jgi:hypothetical protein
MLASLSRLSQIARLKIFLHFVWQVLGCPKAIFHVKLSDFSFLGHVKKKEDSESDPHI